MRCAPERPGKRQEKPCKAPFGSIDLPRSEKSLLRRSRNAGKRLFAGQGEQEPALAPGERQGCNTLKQKNAFQGLRETQEMSLLRPRSNPPFNKDGSQKAEKRQRSLFPCPEGSKERKEREAPLPPPGAN